MISLNLKSLIQRLNPICREELENAAGYTLLRTHYEVEAEHWLKKLLVNDQSDIPEILRAFDVNVAELNIVLDRIIDKFKVGNSRAPGLSPTLIDLIKQSWLLSSIEMSSGTIRSGHIFLVALTEERLRLADSFQDLKKIQLDRLRSEFRKITQRSCENNLTSSHVESDSNTQDSDAKPGEALQQYTVDLVLEAKAGRIDPILGRDDEIRQIIDILSRRRQNNPILAGEAGVGKTAVVEGFALRIASGNVPEMLQNVALRSLDLGLMQAGASAKGEFERRLKTLIDEVKVSSQPVILFIDEAHTLIGAGGSAGQGDAANLLKPALARGELRTIAATTWAEYKKYFEKDAALARRFQVIKVDEPDEDKAIAMVRGLVPVMEKSHKIRLVDEAVRAAVQLSARYIPSRQLPDKAVSVLDTACARVSVSQTTIPAAIEDRKNRISIIDAEVAMHQREAFVGANNNERMSELSDEKETLKNEINLLSTQWEREGVIVKELNELRLKIEGFQTEAQEGAGQAELMNSYSLLANELAALQGEKPLVFPIVDKQSIAEVVQSWTGIPTGRLQSNQIHTVLNMRDMMENRYGRGRHS